MRGIRTSREPWKALPVYVGEGVKILFMGLLLAVLVFIFVLYDPAPDRREQPENPISEAILTVPTLEPDIMALARDETRQQRLVREPEPFRHLLEISLDVVPAVARQLGMPLDPLDPQVLQANPELYRGRYLWSKGTLLDLAGPIQNHPVPGYDLYEGRLATPYGETVMFAFSIPPDPDIAIGDWVRVEGFFLKLRDGFYPEVTGAPMLVGPTLVRDMPDWDPVLALDPEILDSIEDGEFREGTYYEGTDSELTLERFQDTPLWHMASYVIAHKDDMDLVGWRKLDAFSEEEQWLEMMRGETAKGTPMRILGECVEGHWLEAGTNPIGVEHWTEVWVQVHDLGGRVVPVWIPRRVDELTRRKSVEVRGYLFKRHAYDSVRGERRVTPLFLAAAMDPYQTIENPFIAQIGLVVAGAAGGLILLFFLMARRDRLAQSQHEMAMVERRRRRRGRMVSVLGQDA